MDGLSIKLPEGKGLLRWPPSAPFSFVILSLRELAYEVHWACKCVQVCSVCIYRYGGGEYVYTCACRNVPTLVTVSMFNILMLLFSYPVTLYRPSLSPSILSLLSPYMQLCQNILHLKLDGKCMWFLKV